MINFTRRNIDDCPCDGCTERYPACHDYCEDKYKPWKKKKDEERERERQYRMSLDTMSESKKRELWKNNRYQRRKRNQHHTQSD